MKYRADIDGLRAIAVIAVVLFHAEIAAFAGGFVGVDVFFVISGYLITRILVGADGMPTYGMVEFYERRARRILPALFVVCAATTVGAIAVMLPDDLAAYGANLVSVVLYLSNVWFILTQNYFAPAAENNPLLHTWSLSVEEQFYIFYPFVLLLLARLGRQWLMVGVVAGIVVSLGLAEWGAANHPTINFFSLPTRAWELLVGALIALLHAQGTTMNAASLPLRNATTAAGLALIVGTVFLYDASTPFPSVYAIAPVLGSALIILGGGAGGTLVETVLRWRYVVGCGLVSYSLYLWHQPIFALTRYVWMEEQTTLVIGAQIAASVALALLSYRYVETPFRDRSRIGRRAIFTSTAVVTAAFVTVGIALSKLEGLPARLSDAERAEIAAIEAAQKRRIELIAVGTCHYNDALVASVDGFIESWNCAGPDDGSPRTIVIGDSHAADLASALRLAGENVAQLTGAGCSIQWDRMRPRCRRIFTQLLARLDVGAADTVVIAQRWGRTGSTDGLRDDLARWASFGGSLVMAGPRHEFPNFRQKAIAVAERGGRARLASVPNRHKFVARLVDAIAKEAGAASVPVLRLDTPFCALTDGACAPVAADGALLVVDDTHYSELGASLMGPDIAEALRLTRESKGAETASAPQG